MSFFYLGILQTILQSKISTIFKHFFNFFGAFGTQESEVRILSPRPDFYNKINDLTISVVIRSSIA